MAKDQQVCIDQCKFYPETNLLEISGWALELDTKKVPTIDILPKNVLSNKIEWYPRSDVAAAHKTSASLHMGFNLMLSLIHI
ncbi:hypothetical protein KQJ29_27645 [Enterococcus sp. S181_ASV_20]|nr:hypothetical protein [Enterococcus sp. S181_ASV_20]